MGILEKLRAAYDGKTKPFNVDIPSQLHSEVKLLCVAHGITMAQFAVDALEGHLERLRSLEEQPPEHDGPSPSPQEN